MGKLSDIATILGLGIVGGVLYMFASGKWKLPQWPTITLPTLPAIKIPTGEQFLELYPEKKFPVITTLEAPTPVATPTGEIIRTVEQATPAQKAYELELIRVITPLPPPELPTLEQIMGIPTPLVPTPMEKIDLAYIERQLTAKLGGLPLA